ncbi:MAG: iron ABC transporter permease [Synechococcaceae cyanobacterium SM2_3_1]|nr:iron ABC transporter permease [Synechococcaceae cyanobacterium SM2_3_1]
MAASARFQFLTARIWGGAALGIAVLVIIPIGFVLTSLWAETGEIWRHLASTVLPLYLRNSFVLALGVGAGVLLIGVATAWLVTMCQFPGRRFFEWALLLPLAAPAYVLAYTYTDLLQVSGPIQTALRRWLDWGVNDYWFPNIRSLGGAICMLILVLYPYIYLVTRLAFLEQAVRTLEVSRSLGCDPWRSFLTVALPLARPSIVAGLALVVMETLNDYGTVDYFGVQTFTTGIFRTWYGMGERVAATQLAALLLMLVLFLLLLERWSRRQARYFQSGYGGGGAPYLLQGWRRILAWGSCALPIGLGFLLPGAALVLMVIDHWENSFTARFWSFAANSLILATVTAGLAVLLSLILAYGRRLYPSLFLHSLTRMATIGYAVPGSVIAVGILIPLGTWDQVVNTWLQQWGLSRSFVVSGTVIALIYAYLVRFLTVSFSTIEASLSKLKQHLDEAARSLGHGSTSTFWHIHLPLLWKGILTAAILVFVDVMKELPATVVIRPFNFDTLAVRAYQMASDERLAEAAAPALMIVLVGILPVILLSWQLRRFDVASRLD